MTIIFVGCIGDDFIDDIREPEIRIIESIDSLKINTTFMLTTMYLNSAGFEDYK